MSKESVTEKSENSLEEIRKARRKRLTKRLEILRERATLLEMELSAYVDDFFRVCIFGSARIQPEDSIYQLTERLAYYLAKLGIDVLTGGGPGLMEAANKGAMAGCEESGSKSKSFGISIDLGRREAPNAHLDIKHHHKKFSSRLDDFMRLSQAIIVTPGGIGTLLELYFSWQLLQVSHISDRPVILLGKEFWGGLIHWMEYMQVNRGLVSPEDLRWIHLVDTPEEAVEVVHMEYQRWTDQRDKIAAAAVKKG